MKKHIIISMLLLFSLCSKAQTLSLPWMCTFEDSTENLKWVLNSGPLGATCNDKWYVGTADASDGMKSLYISDDEGRDYQFGAKPNLVVAYRDVLLPAGDYEVSFDWKALPARNAGGFYVYWDAVEFQNDPIYKVESNDKAAYLPQYTQPILEFKQSQHDWKNSSFKTGTLPANYPMRLMFVWQNNNKDTLQAEPFASCVDNVQIYSTKCKKPVNIRYSASCDTIKVFWEGSASEYQVQYRKKRNLNWITKTLKPSPTQAIKSYVISGIGEGVYDVRLRSIIGNDTSGWHTESNVLSYCPDNHCLDYTNLYSDAVKCMVGRPSSESSFEKDEAQVPPIDFGPGSSKSRHTVCWSPTTDPRTKNKLKVIPESEFASVRLGNLQEGGTADRLEYDFYVDSLNSILLLNYAMVLQEPGHPDSLDQPGMLLKILEKRPDPFNPGKYDLVPVDPIECSTDRYAAPLDDNPKGWNVETIPGLPGGSKVVWKDWTTVGLDLSSLAGKNIVVRLTAQGCAFQLHFGYAYFTLGCTARQIKGVSCGDVPTMTLEAPYGFYYEWTNEVDPTFFETTQSITVSSNDESKYFCNVISKKTKNCYFTLDTYVNPRIPKADFTYNIVETNCETHLVFKNRSHVQTKKDGVIYSPDEFEATEFHEWCINGGNINSDETTTYVLPKAGGKVEVNLRTTISGGACEDDTTLIINVDSLENYFTHLDTTICYGTLINFGSKIFGQDTVYIDTLATYAGCDSIAKLSLEVHDQIKDIVTYDTICFGDKREIYGKVYNTTGKYKIKHTSKYGCDSIEYMNLFVYPEVLFSYTKTDVENQPHTGEIVITDAPDNYYYTLNGVENAPLTALDAGKYKLIVYNEFNCPSKEKTIIISQDCLKLSIEPQDNEVCSDGGEIVIPFSVYGGVLSKYSLEYNDKALEAGFENVGPDTLIDNIVLTIPNMCRPNNYSVNIIAHDIICDDVVIPFNFSVLYSSTVMVQKWNDVIATLSEDYNGGYTFTNYEWYCNDVLIMDDKGKVAYSKPYLYLSNSNFELNSEYRVKLTRADDGVSMLSCPMQPIVKFEVTDYPTRTVAGTSQQLEIQKISGRGVARWYGVNGILWSESEFSESFTEIETPSSPGFYILEIQTEFNREIYKIYIK